MSMGAKRGGFRKRNALATHELHYGPNMTPMVDVVMVILIFFMASAAIMGPEWFLRSALPVAKPGAPSSAADMLRLQAVLTRDGQSTMLDVVRESGERNRMPIDEFGAFLMDQLSTRRPEQIVVLIVPDSEVPYADIVKLHEVTQRAGVRQAGLYEMPKATELKAKPAVDLPGE